MRKNSPLIKTVSSWLLQHYHDIVFFLLLLIGLSLRLSNLHYPINNAEASRDYLIANHIVAYHEYPLMGPWSGILGPVKNSPLYYYLLAGFLLIKNDILFLGLVNIFLQLVSVFCIYLLAQKMFHKITGLIAAGIFLFSHLNFVQSSEIWQPYVMQLFVNISFLLLYMSHETKKTAYLLAAVFLFIFAGAIHNSTFALLPSFYLFVFMIARLYARPIRTYWAIMAVSCVSIFVWWMPVLLSFIRTHTLNTLSDTATRIFIPQAAAFISHSSNAITSLSYIIRYGGISPYAIAGIALAATCVLIGYRFRNHDADKPYVWILLFAILQMIALTSIINAPLGWHHFTPLFGLSFIVIAEMIRWFSSHGVFFAIIGTLITCSLLYTASNNLDFVHFKIVFNPSPHIFDNTYASLINNALLPLYVVKNGDRPRLQEIERMHQAGNAILRHISTIQNSEHLAAPTSFDIISYKDIGHQRNFNLITSAPFWVLLEKGMNAKLTRTDDVAGNSFEPIGDRRYLFLICHYSTDTDEGCVEVFKKEYPNRAYLTQIYRGESLFSVYRVY